MKRNSLKRMKLVFLNSTYKSFLEAITQLRIDCASGDKKLFMQAYRIEQNLRKRCKISKHGHAIVSLTEKQFSLLKFSAKRIGKLAEYL